MSINSRMKNPKRTLSQEQKISVVSDWQQSKNLANQIKLCIANAYTASIFDELVDVEENTATITTENIEVFISCFCKMAISSLEKYDMFDIKIKGRSEIKKFIHDFLGSFIIDTVLSRFGLISNWQWEDYWAIESESGTFIPGEPEGYNYAEYISKDKDNIVFKLDQTAVNDMRNELVFNNILKELLAYFRSMTDDKPYDLFSPYKFRDNSEAEIPFKDLYKPCYDATAFSKTLPFIPNQIYEVFLNGITNYSLISGQSILYKKENEKYSPNPRNKELLSALNEVIDLILDQAGN